LEERTQAFALEIRWRLEPAEIGEGGIEVHELDRARGNADDFCFWQGYDEGDTSGFFKEQLFLPLAVLAKTPAVVAPEENDGVVAELQAIERVEDFADLGIHEADAGEVGALKDAKLFFFETVVGGFDRQSDRRDFGDVLGRLFGEGNFFEWVKIEVFARGDVRDMGTIEADSEEEGLVFVRFEEADRFGSDLAVGLFFIGAFSLHPAERSTETAAGQKIDDVGFIVAVTAPWVDEFVPGRGIVKAAGADLSRDAVVVKLPHARGEIAVVLEELRQRDYVREDLADRSGVVVNAGGVGAKTAQERRAAGIAERILAVGAVEADAARGEAVNVWRFDERMVVAAEGGVEVVNGDEENVQWWSGGFFGGEG